MTKSEFLELLEKNLKPLSVEERNKTITYYSEMISDMIDSGLTQEEAVAKLGNPGDIAKEIIDNAREQKKETVLNQEPTFKEVKKETPVQKELKNTKRIKAWPFVLCGVLLLVAVVAVQVIGSIYFSNLPREKQVKEFTVSMVNNISFDVEVDGLKVLPAEGDKIVYEYYTNQRHEYEVELENGKLEIDSDYRFSFFSDYSLEDYTSTLYLPKEFTGDFDYDGATGAIYLELDHTFNNVKIEVATGLASIKNIKCASLEIDQSTGSVRVSNIVANNTFVKTSTGEARIENSKTDELVVKQSTGSTKLSNITGLTGEMKKVNIESSTGEVKFDNINALDIYIKVSTGSIKGTFADSIDNYTITSTVSTGDSNLPNNFGDGPKKLVVKASTGNIEIDFAD